MLYFPVFTSFATFVTAMGAFAGGPVNTGNNRITYQEKNNFVYSSTFRFGSDIDLNISNNFLLGTYYYNGTFGNFVDFREYDFNYRYPEGIPEDMTGLPDIIIPYVNEKLYMTIEVDLPFYFNVNTYSDDVYVYDGSVYQPLGTETDGVVSFTEYGHLTFSTFIDYRRLTDDYGTCVFINDDYTYQTIAMGFKDEDIKLNGRSLDFNPSFRFRRPGSDDFTYHDIFDLGQHVGTDLWDNGIPTYNRVNDMPCTNDLMTTDRYDTPFDIFLRNSSTYSDDFYGFVDEYFEFSSISFDSFDITHFSYLPIQFQRPMTTINLYYLGPNDNTDDGYINGYDDGYSSGFGVGASHGAQEGYDEGFREGYGTGYREGTEDADATAYQEGYQAGIATADNGSFLGLFSTIVDVPIMYIRKMFGYELFGINLFSALMSLLTLLVVLFCIKKLV